MFNINIKTEDYMSIILTHDCNKSCPFCVDKYRTTDSNDFISLKNVRKALEFAKNKDIKDILLVGGEPTLHPDVLKIAEEVKKYGFNLILTTNYTNPNITKKLDKYVDSFNFSYYGQNNFPNAKEFSADITISCLIYAGKMDTKEKLDNFIDTYRNKGYIMKFSTLSACNDFARKHQKVSYLNNLPAKKIILFNEIEGQIYRNCVIKRYDKIVNNSADQSYKCHVNGIINKQWEVE